VSTSSQVPNLDLLNGAEPFCVQALVRQGGLPNEGFEAAATTLASYCIAAQLNASHIQLLGIRLAQAFMGHSLRDTKQRQRYVSTLCQQRPATVELFTCERMRSCRTDSHRDGLRFACDECAVCLDGQLQYWLVRLWRVFLNGALRR
jgi:hypothetical protein